MCPVLGASKVTVTSMNTHSTIPIPPVWATGPLSLACHSRWTLSRWRATLSSLPQVLSSRTSASHQAPLRWRTTERSPTCITTSPYPHRPSRTPSFIHHRDRPTNLPFLHPIPSTRSLSTLAPWTSVINGHTHFGQHRRTWPTRCLISSCTTRPMATPCSQPPLAQILPPLSPPAIHLVTLTPVRSLRITLFGLPVLV